MCNDLNFSIPLLADRDCVAQITNTVVNLDLLIQKLLEGGDVEDFVRGWLGRIDNELSRSSCVSDCLKCKRECFRRVATYLLCDLPRFLTFTCGILLSQGASALGFLHIGAHSAYCS